MNQLTAITGASPLALISSDAEGAIVAFNPAAERLFEYGESQILGQSVELLVPTRLVDAYRINVARAASQASAKPAPIVLTGLKRSGEEFPIEVNFSKWSEGGRQYFTAMVEDKSPCRRTEQKLARLFSAVTGLLEGQVLDGRYQLERVVRKDGFGALYEALDLEQRAAVNVRIVRTLASLESQEVPSPYPYSVELLDLGATELGLPYSVTEHLSGERLSDRISRKGTITQLQAVTWGKCLAESLTRAHARGDVHGTLSTASVFLRQTTAQNPRLTVLDFELRQLVGSSPASAELLISELGAFCAPEIRSGLAATPATDVYAFALVLGSLFSTTMPPNADCEVELRQWLLASLPRSFANLALRALSLDPTVRPPSNAFEAALAPVDPNRESLA